MSDINSLQLNIEEWNLFQQTPNRIEWRNEIPDALTLNFFSIPPDIPCALSDRNTLQEFYAQMMAQTQGRMVDLASFTISDLQALRVIIKLPQSPSGLSYLGSFTIPFKNSSYVIKVQCPEYGTTGMREVVIADRLLAERIQNGKTISPEEMQNFAAQIGQQSDEPRYDAEFPSHPLSRTRRYLAQIEQALQVDPALYQLEKFAS